MTSVKCIFLPFYGFLKIFLKMSRLFFKALPEKKKGLQHRCFPVKFANLRAPAQASTGITQSHGNIIILVTVLILKNWFQY